MKDLVKEVKNFLGARSKEEGGIKRPLLVAYSGGPDSTALLHLLLECRRFYPLNIHLAHVNHGWRDESLKEAEELEKKAAEFNIPFYLQTFLSRDFSPQNLEEQGRIKRLAFFAQLYEKIQPQALLMGHHADDQAEIVLKRVFEGSSLYALGGLSPASDYEKMRIWRPLLKCKKKDLLLWLNKEKLNYLIDPTNESDRFLRGKMRTAIVPLLSQAFGKEVAENLCFLGREAQELTAFFHSINEPLFKKLQLDKKPLEVDLNLNVLLHPLTIKFILKQWLSAHSLSVSREILEGMVKCILEGKVQKDFRIKKAFFSISRRRICLNKLN